MKPDCVGCGQYEHDKMSLFGCGQYEHEWIRFSDNPELKIWICSPSSGQYVRCYCSCHTFKGVDDEKK